jgi:hypothetical protein
VVKAVSASWRTSGSVGWSMPSPSVGSQAAKVATMAADHDHPGGYLLTIPAPRSSLRPRQASGLAGTVRLASQAHIVKGGAMDPTRKLYLQ